MAPKTRKELRGMVNYYQDMWIHCSDILAPLTALTSKNVQWAWTAEHQAAFDKAKALISREVMLAFPDFSLSQTCRNSGESVSAIITSTVRNS